MIYCVEIYRRAIGEENVVDHFYCDSEPTEQDILDFIISLDCGFDEKSCKFNYYRVG